MNFLKIKKMEFLSNKNMMKLQDHNNEIDLKLKIFFITLLYKKFFLINQL